MIAFRIGMVAVTFAALTLAGCQSQRFAPMQSQGRVAQPLTPAPAGTVTSQQLPPPGGPTDPGAFPEPPRGADASSSQQVASAAGAAGGAPLTAGRIAGVWDVSVSGQGCRIATPQTRFGQGFRAGPLRCPAPLDSVRSWNVDGSQLALYDQSGSVLARLYHSGGERFDGQTTNGQSVSFSR